MKVVRDSNNLNRVIKSFLQRYGLFNDSDPWIIKESELGGLGVFATRDIEPGEIILRDYPVILGPRVSNSSLCVNCYETNPEVLAKCEKNCGLLVCSEKCQKSQNHQRECKVISQWKHSDIDLTKSPDKMVKCLTPIRSLLLSSDDKEVVQHLKAHVGGHHGFEVDLLKDEMKLNIKEDEENFMRFVCAVLDANAFEVVTENGEKQSTLRGLYPLGSLSNHSCVPNAYHVFDKNQIMIVRASVFIPDGSEIFQSYTRIIWATPTRIYHLYRTKHFLCKCPRCCDPTEMGTYMAALKCGKCSGYVMPIDCLKIRTKWRCETCQDIVNEDFVSSRMTLLGSILASLIDSDLKFLLRFFKEKLPALVQSNNQVQIEAEYRLIWILGYTSNYLWHELTQELLSLKEEMCRHILSLLENLRSGLTKMRGMLLYELYCTIKWRRTKSACKGGKQQVEEIPDTPEMKSLLEESADILMCDSAAPEEIKKLWVRSAKLKERKCVT